MPPHPPTRRVVAGLVLGLSAAFLAGCSDDATTQPSGRSTPSPTDTVPVLQPGKPGEPNSTLSGSALSPKSRKPHDADVTFMQDMIVHHSQAVTMVDIVDGKLTDPQVQKMATRIGKEQKPEMRFMRTWLQKHDQKVPSPGGATGEHEGHGGHDDHGGHHGHEDMPGMATPAQLDRLRSAKGSAKDFLFLDLMSKHHRGALVMVDDLVKAGGGQDTDVDKFSGDIYAAQSAQIRSMSTMRSRLEGETTESASAPSPT